MTPAPTHSLIPRRKIDPAQELPALELDVLERWRTRGVFAKSLQARAGAEQWVFYEGPPTANGPPGAHHVLSRVFKDIYPRFKTMRGYRVERKGGWDCHGLPVEISVEQELGIRSKAEIEAYGIREFNERCRDSVFAYLQDWDRLTERIGFWLDLDDAYRTLDESYIESVWWALAEIDARGLLYEGRKVVPYCPRCESTLSSHEVALGYADTVDPSVFLKLPASGSEDRLLVWTTTPWTLPGNVALAVSPQARYARVRVPGDEVFVLAEARVQAVLANDAEVLEHFSGQELAARYRTYEGPVFPASDREPGAYPIVADDFVTTADGTGIVHLAPAFGEDDYRVAAQAPEVPFDAADAATLYNPVRRDGTFDERVQGRDGRSFAGRFVKDEQLTRELIEDLQARGLLLKVEQYEHSYPHCWRCGTPLLYYAKSSWYIATSRLREQLLAANETVHWYPPHVKHGRFGDWLANNVDWALSRERYWGTPLPVWRCAEGHTQVLGSFAELQRRSGRALSDHHRPFVDELEFACEHPAPGAPGACGKPMRRVPEVIDVWFDSGAMPFAQHHYPFEGQELFAERFPADFICEAQDQTRGWFYSLLAIATLLGWEAPYRNVVCLGLILDEAGQKMSKSRGNTVEPWSVLDRYGADAFRWYFFTAKAPWDGYRFAEQAIGEGVRLFLKQLWSTYFFYVLYAHAGASELERAAAPPAQLQLLDRWALSRAAGTAELVAERLDAYDTTAAGRAIAELVEDLSNWYVRRSRRRFWEGDASAFATLRTCLLTVAKLLAPFCPFISDEIYDNLDGARESVHLCDFPVPAAAAAQDRGRPDAAQPPAQVDLPLVRDGELERSMALARETVRLGLGARGKAKRKVRQPLAEAVVVAAGREREAIELLSETVREELNVKRVRFVAAAEELGSYEVKANYRKLGPLFGKDMPLAAQAIASLDPDRVAAAVRAQPGDGGQAAGAGDAPAAPRIGITVAGREHTLSSEDVIVTLRAPEGYSVEREGAHAVALDLAIDDELRREGYAREIVHAVQNARKNAGLAVEDRIELALDGDPQLLAAAKTHSGYVSGETLAPALALGSQEADGEPAAHREQTLIEGLQLAISLRRSDAR